MTTWSSDSHCYPDSEMEWVVSMCSRKTAERARIEPEADEAGRCKECAFQVKVKEARDDAAAWRSVEAHDGP